MKSLQENKKWSDTNLIAFVAESLSLVSTDSLDQYETTDLASDRIAYERRFNK
jgi:hypothetical protein